MTTKNTSLNETSIPPGDLLTVMAILEADGRWLDSLCVYVGAKVDDALEEFNPSDRTLVQFGSSLVLELVNVWAANRSMRILASTKNIRD